jgi:hypothetical protein
MILGTARWSEGGVERRALVSPLPSDPERLVDLHRVERIRLAKLGEGRAELLAEALVPGSLRQILEGGARALSRLRQTLAYADKWHGRNPLPESLAPRLREVRLLPCLPRPSALRRFDGTHLDRLSVGGPGATVHGVPRPTLALVGLHAGRPAGICLALEEGESSVLGAWLSVGQEPGGLSLHCRGEGVEADTTLWQDLPLPSLRPGEVLLLPLPTFRPLAVLVPGARFEVRADFETLPLRLGREALHPTVQ